MSFIEGLSKEEDAHVLAVLMTTVQFRDFHVGRNERVWFMTPHG